MSLEFYAEQTPVTDPGGMSGWLAGLPVDIPALRRIARGLVVHYRTEDLTALGIPPDRVGEINTRYAERMLERLSALDDRPLTEQRPPEKRLVGCCRDFTVLFLMLMRHQNIPARARVGFASYFISSWNVDHEVAEVWDANEERWRLIDAELDDNHTDEADGSPSRPSTCRAIASSWPERHGTHAAPATPIRTGFSSIPRSTSQRPVVGHNCGTT